MYKRELQPSSLFIVPSHSWKLVHVEFNVQVCTVVGSPLY